MVLLKQAMVFWHLAGSLGIRLGHGQYDSVSAHGAMALALNDPLNAL